MPRRRRLTDTLKVTRKCVGVRAVKEAHLASSRSLRGLLRRSLFVRPAAFVISGVVLAVVTLGLDDGITGSLVPAFLHFGAETARTLLGTLAGAMLTLAGITFWVRAASVQLAAGQFSNRVVHGFLEDWFQQSIMGLLLGIFAYIVAVFRVVPNGGFTDVPQLSVNVALALAGGSIFVILHAIRNSVRSMQVDQLARRITDDTVERIREFHPAAEALQITSTSVPPPPAARGTVVRATGSGWVQRIDQSELLAALPENVTVRLEVREGLFVLRGRPVCTVWGAALDTDAVAEVCRRVRLGRGRTTGGDVEYGIQQLVDLVVGSLAQGLSDVTSVHEVLAHLEMIFAELAWRQLPPKSFVDDDGRRVLRPREFSFDDYARTAFERLRRAGAAFPDVTVAVLELLATLARDLNEAGHHERAGALWRQARMLVEASEAASLFAEDLAWVKEVAARHGVDVQRYEAATDQSASSASPSAPVNPLPEAARPRATA